MTVNEILLAMDVQRKRLGLSWARVTVLCGLAHDTISLWMRGVSRPNLETIMMVAKVLGMEIVIRTEKVRDEQ